MNSSDNAFARFFGVIARKQTYLNMLHVLLSFPLGLFYFVFLVTGLAVGIGTIIIWIGLLILAMVMAAWFLFILFERQLAAGLLQVKMNPLETPRTRMAGTTWRKVVAYLKNPVTWKGLLYLFLKFPLGVGFFSVGTSFLAITISFLVAPIGYRFFYPEVWFTMEKIWRVDTLGEAMILFVVGALLLFVTLHLINGMAWISAQLAKALLDNPSDHSQEVLTEGKFSNQLKSQDDQE